MSHLVKPSRKIVNNIFCLAAEGQTHAANATTVHVFRSLLFFFLFQASVECLSHMPVLAL